MMLVNGLFGAGQQSAGPTPPAKQEPTATFHVSTRMVTIEVVASATKHEFRLTLTLQEITREGPSPD